MKTKFSTALLLLATLLAHSQGTFIYDQQSTNFVEGSADLYQPAQPMGQSFTPAFSSIAFVRLYLIDVGNLAEGATVFVNLRADSITGANLGSSSLVPLPNNYFGFTDFLFSVPVAVTPGVTYYFQPVIQSGDNFASAVTDGSYVGGTGFSQGVPVSGANLWFQEGIVIVPEPSPSLLALLGSGAWLFLRRQHTR